MKPDFTSIDTAILAAIQSGSARTYTAIGYQVEPLARDLTNRKDWMRVVDRRLQALRRRGLIKFAAKEWRVLAPHSV